MEPFVIAVLFVIVSSFLFISILINRNKNVEIKEWKKISTLQEDLIKDLKKELKNHEELLDLYKELCKTNDVRINAQKEYINELLEIVKTQK